MTSLSSKIHFLFPFILLFAIISCNDEEIVYPEGGYPYLKNIVAKDSDFYFLPIRHMIPKKDSLRYLYGKELYTSFNEPNLSLTAPQNDIFRYMYESTFVGEYAFITLADDKIIIKRSKSGSPFLMPDFDCLNPIERLHYKLLDGGYPLEEAKFPEWKRKYVDSLIKVYPELLDPAYFKRLKDKVFSVYQGPFTYSTKVVKIQKSRFNYFIDLINNSEFWQRPCYQEGCAAVAMDGGGFLLEAITKKKYHLVTFDYCLDSSSKFQKAYNEILKYAGIQDNELGRQDSTSYKTEQVQIRELKLEELKPEPKSKKKAK